MTYNPNQTGNGEQARPTDLEETAEIPLQSFRDYEAIFGDSFEFEGVVESLKDPLRQLWGKRDPQKRD